MKKILSMVLALVMVAGGGVCANAFETEVPPGYTAIRTAADLNAIRNNLTGNYILMNDIDLAGMNWTPIGVMNMGEEGTAPIASLSFSGILDGNGHVIKNMHIAAQNQLHKVIYVGLFTAVINGVVKNLGIENASIAVNYQADWDDVYLSYPTGAIVAGLSSVVWGGTISDCFFKGAINVSVTKDFDYGVYYIIMGGIAGSCAGETIFEHNYSVPTFTYNDFEGCNNTAYRNFFAISDNLGYGTGYNFDSYYLDNGFNYGDSMFVLGLTDAQMKQRASFVGWDFDNIWAIDEGGSYPYFKSGNTEPPHTHAFGAAWLKDATNHWHECACGEKSGLAAHTPGGWIVDTPATVTTPGSRHRQCTVCGYVTATEVIPATGGGSQSGPGKLFGTKYDATLINYILFFLCFGFIWMWF